ncbi:hypothetical protein ASE22_06290 [Sphingomonas sp. Root720]|uniref:hypothetical protein n=1 Tax=Sphingomonas sp. Root50 TaxID=1736551 RepID=UPI0006F6336E|nr:hypothetical protein [Sphingomonas sp. Root50]KRB91579.1 hypothetical protein ASE22_06290 [Sphingomonas sp. Root720]
MESEGRQLVQLVREAALRHATSWEALVPNAFEIDLDAEEAEESAYADMALAKRALRDHICAVYGISLRELGSLAAP